MRGGAADEVIHERVTSVVADVLLVLPEVASEGLGTRMADGRGACREVPPRLPSEGLRLRGCTVWLFAAGLVAPSLAADAGKPPPPGPLTEAAVLSRVGSLVTGEMVIPLTPPLETRSQMEETVEAVERLQTAARPSRDSPRLVPIVVSLEVTMTALDHRDTFFGLILDATGEGTGTAGLLRLPHGRAPRGARLSGHGDDTPRGSRRGVAGDGITPTREGATRLRSRLHGRAGEEGGRLRPTMEASWRQGEDAGLAGDTGLDGGPPQATWTTQRLTLPEVIQGPVQPCLFRPQTPSLAGPEGAAPWAPPLLGVGRADVPPTAAGGRAPAPITRGRTTPREVPLRPILHAECPRYEAPILLGILELKLYRPFFTNETARLTSRARCSVPRAPPD